MLSIDLDIRAFSVSEEADIVEADGRIYEKQRDPPGQKCIYILPGETFKESYRVCTLIKFPEEIPVDVCALANHGFFYTGYKDRVKCFSCGSNVLDWKVFDDPRDAKWHFDQCKLVLGIETKNQPINMNKEIVFIGVFTSTVHSLDRGYDTMSTGTSSAPKELSMTQNARPVASPSDATMMPVASSTPEVALTQSIKVMQIGNKNQVAIQNDAAVLPHQTARVVQPKTTGPPKVEGLVFASIHSNYHLEILTKTLNLHREKDRRKSFFGWAYFFVPVTPDLLAKVGFFYLGNADRVQCFSCCGVLRNWKEGDDVDQQHMTHFPYCKMVLRTERRNIPLPNALRKAAVRKPLAPVEPADPSPQELESLQRQFPCSYPGTRTFDHRWPKPKVIASPRHTVNAGFWPGDRGRAKYYNGRLKKWKPNDEPFTDHANEFPGMVLRTERRNIPLPNALRKVAVRKPLAPVEPADPNPQELESLKRLFPCSFPVNPHMRNFEDRLQTFDHRWPKQKDNASPRHISKAGFFFLGDRDRAKCWYCNGGLQNWEPNDEPFTEHAKWFPGCEYILQCKGVDFVKRIVAKTPNLNRPTLRHPRFDHRTGKLVSLNVHPDQQQPVIIDPRANVSAGSVLRNHSTSTSSSESKNSAMVNGVNHSQSESANTEMENVAIGMGFDKAKIKRVIERQMRNNGSTFDDANQLIKALIEEPSDSVDIPPPAAPAPEASVEVGGFHGNQGMQVDLKQRSNETLEVQNKNSTEGEESPLKKTKTDSTLNTELENSRKCKLCLKNNADSVVMPCGHLSLCSSCGNEAKICPLCKVKKQSLIRAYLR